MIMKKSLQIFLYILSAISLLLVLFLIFISTLNTEVLISNLTKSIEKELFLKVSYNYEKKPIIQILRGIELKDVKIYDNTKEKEPLMLSAREFRIQFDIISLIFSKDPEVYLYCRDIKTETSNIINYLNSPKVKEKFSKGNPSQNSQQIPIKLVRLENLEILLDKQKINTDVSIEDFNNLKIWGYIYETKTKFSFKEKLLTIDRVILDKKTKINTIYVNINEDFSEGRGKIKNISYENIMIKDVNFNINLKDNFKTTAEVTEASIQNLTFSNIIVSLNTDKKEISINAIKDKLRANVFLYNPPKVDLKINNLTYLDLPQGLIDSLSNTIKDITIDGSLTVSIDPKLNLNKSDLNKLNLNKLNLNGIVNIFAKTTIKNELFSNIPIVVEFKNQEAKISSFLDDKKTDIKVLVYANINIETNISISLKNIEMHSKNLYVSSFTTPVGNNNSNRKENKTELEGIEIENTPFYISIENLYLQGKTPELQGIEIKGTMNNGKTKITGSYSVVGFLFKEVEVKGNGEVSLGEKIHSILNTMPTKANLGKMYKNVSFFDFGGEVYGNVYIDKSQIEIGDNLTIKSKINLEKIELINIKIQNEITKLLNIDLSHLFVDSGVINLNINGTNISLDGEISGDVETKFYSQIRQYPERSEIEFDYLKVNRSIINDVPRMFFITREINGIKYKIDDDYITFDKFKVNF